MNSNENQKSTIRIIRTEYNNNNNNNTLTGTGTGTAAMTVTDLDPDPDPNPATVSVSALELTSAATEPLKLNSIPDPELLKSMLVDILHSAINSIEIIELEKLFNNNIIQSNINNNTIIQSKLTKLNEIIQQRNKFYRLNSNQFSAFNNDIIAVILQYLSINEICKIKSTNNLIYLAINSPILLNQLIIQYNPLYNKPEINLININSISISISISMNLISHLEFHLNYHNISNINNLSQLNQLKSIKLYIETHIDNFELNFINKLLLLQHISIRLYLYNNSKSILFDDIAVMLSNINTNRININGKLLSIELMCHQVQSSNTLLSDIGLITICNNCPELKYLQLYNTNITDAGLIYLKQLNSLERLSIAVSGSITDSGLLVILELGNSLTQLDLSGNHNLSNSYLSIISQLPELKLFKFELKEIRYSKFLNELSPAEGLKLLSKSKSIETLIIDSQDRFSYDLSSNLIDLSTLRNLLIFTRYPITDSGIDSISKLIQLTGLELIIASKSQSDYRLLNKLSKLINLKSLVLNLNYYNSNIENEFKSNPELYSMMELIHMIPSLLYFSMPNHDLYKSTIAREYNQNWSKLLYKQRPTLYYDTNYGYNTLLKKQSKWFNTALRSY